MNILLWCSAYGTGDAWCAQRTRTKTLCDREIIFLPVVQPVDPGVVHDDCARIIAAGDFVPPHDEQAEGTCPVCVGQAPVSADGRIDTHRQWRYERGALVVTELWCDGAGGLPEVAS